MTNFRLLYRCMIVCLAVLCILPEGSTQKSKKKKAETNSEKHAIDELSLSALKWRCVGPALTSGRIADIAVHPDRPYEYIVATASGGVWKTVNSGTTFRPVFDGQGSYSIGCVTYDPNQPSTVWVGSGENNNQRSVAYGDGIYKSTDGGNSWKNMGLKDSEHIGKIIVHPDNSDVVYVAAIGPLWSKGGERGVYKTMDGGSTWNLVLELDEHTGVNDIVMDPRDPDVIYAAALQRRRHVYTYVGGGPGSGMYKTTDGGQSWDKINSGLPTVEMGRIGLAIAPSHPDYVYAIVEAAQGKGGTYLTTNGGASWSKQSGRSTSGNYYQEIIVSPHDHKTIYSMDTWMKVSFDAGKSWNHVGEDTKHVDNHSMWIDPSNADHWLVGCDGGIYETFDAAKTWDFKKNLPVTQFYKVSVDNAEPFYNIFGGTQDNFSLGGPSRVTNSHGIVNEDWFITHGGDGFETQVDPENPNIIYAQSQYGVLVRYDKQSGEELGIQPKERKGENAYRWNWDAPLIASPHQSGRVYFAANKVFKSDDYGHSWEVISEDLTRQLDRNQLKVYDRIVGINSVMKNGSTSPYGTIVAMSESALNPDLLAIGTDDGLIQITEDGGQSWRKIDNIPGAPRQSYVNAVFLSQHDEAVIYAAYNHHKYGDFKPYLFKSSDKGLTWKNISNNLPERGSVYAIEEDHVDADLIFCGTEFGAFCSVDGGARWKKLGAGLPTIAVRDIAIQRRENDLVLGTFGRGFYVMDDYSPLRSIENKKTEDLVRFFDVRDALVWEQDKPLGLPGKSFQGDNYYTADNLGPVALIRYQFSDKYESLKKKREKEESKSSKDKRDTPYPSYEDLKAEQDEREPKLVLEISDAGGKVIRRVTRSYAEGVQEYRWNMRYNEQGPISLGGGGFYNPFAGVSEGSLVPPGTYSVTLSQWDGIEMKQVAGPQSFEVKALKNTSMPAADRPEKTAFQQEVEALSADISVMQRRLGDIGNKMRHIKKAAEMMNGGFAEAAGLEQEINDQLEEVNLALYGDPIKSRLDIDQPPTPATRIGWIMYEQKYSTSAPTATHQSSFAIAKEEFASLGALVDDIEGKKLKALESLLNRYGAPYTPGRNLGDN